MPFLARVFCAISVSLIQVFDGPYRVCEDHRLTKNRHSETLHHCQPVAR